MASPTDLYDPRAGGESLRVGDVRFGAGPHEPARTNYFGVYRIDSGAGAVAADAAFHPFGPGGLLFFAPYQYVRFAADRPLRGEVIDFHANFLCVETFHAEAGCSGALFNDPFGGPVLPLDPEAAAEFTDLFARVRRELEGRGLAHEEAALAYLKVLLILASRRKAADGAACATPASAHRHPVIAGLAALIEEHYRAWHAPAAYADALHLTAKTLGRVVREQLGTTPTDLIRARLLTHAKWQLLHTLRPVKEIAAELGFGDELYFSRLFKKATGLSPTHFREFETVIRNGSNLSMPSSPPSILPPTGGTDNSVIAATGPGLTGAAAGRGTRRGRGHERAEAV
jgi:AraC family transcriptional activator of pobA